MKINIEVEQTVNKEIELETPAYYTDEFRNYLITEDAVLQIGGTLAIFWTKEKHSGQYYKQISEILDESKPSTKEVFDKAYNDFLLKINEITLTKELV